jgi:hypothetical protein
MLSASERAVDDMVQKGTFSKSKQGFRIIKFALGLQLALRYA